MYCKPLAGKMATISIAGTVTGRPGESPLTVKTFDNGDNAVSFSVADRAYVYTKPGTESQGQFYRCEVRGKTAEIVMERVKRGDKIGVSGQLVQRMYNEKLYLDIRNASVTFL
jgi:single-stranded DNA-binding protein